MRRLFIPLCLALLFGCDGAAVSPSDSGLVGAWRLTGISTASGDPIEAPVGSVLAFGQDGALALRSGNTCSGAFEVRGSALTLDLGACTEIGTDATDDLAVVFQYWDHPGSPVVTYSIGESSPPQLFLAYSRPDAALTLRFVLE